MKTLHLHLVRQVVATLVLTVAVFAGVLLLGNVLKEVLALLVNGQVSLTLVVKAVGYLIPYVLVHALPMGLLTAMLLVFGRLSADQELTAARASGISLVSLVSPLILLSMVMTALCAYVNLELAPTCRVAYKNLFTAFALENPGAPIPEGRFVRDFPGYLIYAGKVRGTNLEDVLFCQFKDNEKVLDVRAETARILIDPASREVRFEFSNAQIFRRLTDLPDPSVSPAPTNSLAATNLPPAGDSATNHPGSEPGFTGTRWQPVIIPGTYTSEEPLVLPEIGGGNREPKLTDLSFQQLMAKRYELRSLGIQDATPVQKALRSQVEVQLHRQVSYSFACIGFTLIGIPLGIRVHRRETSVGGAVAVFLVLLYYGLTLLGQSMQAKSDLAARLLLWLPNVLFQSIGAILLWRANRRG